MLILSIKCINFILPITQRVHVLVLYTCPNHSSIFTEFCFMLHLLTVEILSVLILLFIFLLIAYHISMFYSNKPNSRPTILQ